MVAASDNVIINAHAVNEQELLFLILTCALNKYETRKIPKVPIRRLNLMRLNVCRKRDTVRMLLVMVEKEETNPSTWRQRFPSIFTKDI